MYNSLLSIWPFENNSQFYISHFFRLPCMWSWYVRWNWSHCAADHIMMSCWKLKIWRPVRDPPTQRREKSSVNVYVSWSFDIFHRYHCERSVEVNWELFNEQISSSRLSCAVDLIRANEREDRWLACSFQLDFALDPSRQHNFFFNPRILCCTFTTDHVRYYKYLT